MPSKKLLRWFTNWLGTHLPALVTIISVPSRLNSCHNVLISRSHLICAIGNSLLLPNLTGDKPFCLSLYRSPSQDSSDVELRAFSDLLPVPAYFNVSESNGTQLEFAERVEQGNVSITSKTVITQEHLCSNG